MDEKNKSSLSGYPEASGSNSASDHTPQGNPADNDEKRNLPSGKAKFASSSESIRDDDPEYDDALSFWEPKPPKVLMEDPNEQPLELRSQIQLYAMNEYAHSTFVKDDVNSLLGS